MKNPLLTVPIHESDPKSIEKILKQKLPRVDAFEIWVDQLKKTDQIPERLELLVQSWRKLTDKKLVIVCKDKEERGRFKGNTAEKIERLLAAARGGAHYIDIGLHSGKASIRKLVTLNKRSKVIISHHDFVKTPNAKRLARLTQQMKDLGADVVKIATMVESPQDNENLMELAMDLKKAKLRHIVIGMGQIGIMTRVFSKPLGNELNFVTLENKTAPGQLSLEQMIQFHQVFGYSHGK